MLRGLSAFTFAMPVVVPAWSDVQVTTSLADGVLLLAQPSREFVAAQRLRADRSDAEPANRVADDAGGEEGTRRGQRDRDVGAILLVAALEQRFGLVDPADADVEVGQAVAHRAHLAEPADLAQRRGVRVDEMLVRASPRLALALAHLDHQLEERGIEDVAVDVAAQDLDHLIEVERVVLVRGGGERRGFDRDIGVGKPRRAAARPCSRTTSETRSARATCSVILSQSSSCGSSGGGGVSKSGSKWSSQVAPPALRAWRAAAISSADNQLILIVPA